MAVKNNRRTNLRLLAQALGGIAELANFLNKSPSQLSHLIGAYASKNIGDRIATEIELAFAKPLGWLDHDYGGHEGEVLATAVPPRDCRAIPLLKKTTLSAWLAAPEQHARTQPSYETIYTSIAVSPSAYGYILQSDSMEAAGPFTFVKNSLLIVDPAVPLRPQAFILIQQSSGVEPILRQALQRNDHWSLKALNTRYPELVYQKHYAYCGTARAALLTRPRW